MSTYSQWIREAREYALDYVRTHMPDKHYFHNQAHVEQVVHAAEQLAGAAGLDTSDRAALLIAAWFHDLGYAEGAKDHEARSAAKARLFLEERQAEASFIRTVEAAILATRMPQNPENHLQSLMADADLSHLGGTDYWHFIGLLREEMKAAQGKVMDDEEWLAFEVSFMEKHRFHTLEAETLFGKRKKKHLKKLRKMQASASGQGKSAEVAAPKFTKPGRGVETMFRSAYRTHINLSSIADNKANIMLSINAIILSITISTLVPRFYTDPQLVVPTILLLMVCLTAIVFATLSTMPKVTQGTVSRESIEKGQANLIFFGNFFNMPLADYQWGMQRLIRDEPYVYDTMTKDLYFLGLVLAKKYAYLRWCYLIFMYGLIATVIAFAVNILL
jgi:hypothetical protein